MPSFLRKLFAFDKKPKFGVCLLFVVALALSCAHAQSTFDTDVWETFGGLPGGCNGRVFVIKPLLDGDLVVGGEFTTCGSASVNNIAIRRANGSWEALGTAPAGAPAPGTNGAVHAIAPRIVTENNALVVERIFFGGAFTEAGGFGAQRVAQFLEGQIQPVGSTAANGVSGAVAGDQTVVRDMLLRGTNATLLVVVGNFTNVAGAGSECVGMYSMLSDRWIASLGAGISTKAGAYKLLPRSPTDNLTFITNVVDDQRTLSYTIDTVGPLSLSGTTIARGSVYDMGFSFLQNQATIFGVGNFDIGGVSFQFAQLGAAGWIGIPGVAGNGNTDDFLRMSIVGDTIALLNTTACGAATSALCYWNRRKGEFTAISGFPVMTDAYGREILPYENGFLIGGEFTNFGNLIAHNILKVSAAGAPSALAFGNGNDNGIRGQVYAFAVSSDLQKLYVGGNFLTAGNLLANGIAVWDGRNWSTLGAVPAGEVPGVDGRVHTISVIGTDVYIGGSFTQINGQAISKIARFNGQNWSAVGAPLPGNSTVNAIARGGRLCVALSWQQNPTGAGMQCLDGVSNLWASETVGQNGLALIANNTAVIGGDMSRAVQRKIGMFWEPYFLNSSLGSSPSGRAIVNSMVETTRGLIVAGDFERIAIEPPLKNLARAGAGTWDSMSTQTLDGPLLSVISRGGDVCIGGKFSTLNGRKNNVSCQRPGGWRALGATDSNGTNDQVRAMIAIPTELNRPSLLAGKLFVGGDFSAVEGIVSNGIAAFGEGKLFANGFEN